MWSLRMRNYRSIAESPVHWIEYEDHCCSFEPPMLWIQLYFFRIRIQNFCCWYFRIGIPWLIFWHDNFLKKSSHGFHMFTGTCKTEKNLFSFKVFRNYFIFIAVSGSKSEFIFGFWFGSGQKPSDSFGFVKAEAYLRTCYCSWCEH
jgi:hypothetical protein